MMLLEIDIGFIPSTPGASSPRWCDWRTKSLNLRIWRKDFAAGSSFHHLLQFSWTKYAWMWCLNSPLSQPSTTQTGAFLKSWAIGPSLHQSVVARAFSSTTTMLHPLKLASLWSYWSSSGSQIQPQPPYTPDLTPCNFCSSPNTNVRSQETVLSHPRSLKNQ